MVSVTTKALSVPTVIGRTNVLALKGDSRLARVANLTGTEVKGLVTDAVSNFSMRAYLGIQRGLEQMFALPQLNPALAGAGFNGISLFAPDGWGPMSEATSNSPLGGSVKPSTDLGKFDEAAAMLAKITKYENSLFGTGMLTGTLGVIGAVGSLALASQWNPIAFLAGPIGLALIGTGAALEINTARLHHFVTVAKKNGYAPLQITQHFAGLSRNNRYLLAISGSLALAMSILGYVGITKNIFNPLEHHNIKKETPFLLSFVTFVLGLMGTGGTAAYGISAPRMRAIAREFETKA